MNKHIYGSPKEPKYQVDHARILSVMAGQDKLTTIGDPSIPGGMSMEQAWVKSVESYFPLKHSLAEADENEDKELGDISKYAEAKVDAMKIQKDEELTRSELFSKEKPKGKAKPTNKIVNLIGKVAR